MWGDVGRCGEVTHLEVLLERWHRLARCNVAELVASHVPQARERRVTKHDFLTAARAPE